MGKLYSNFQINEQNSISIIKRAEFSDDFQIIDNEG